MQQAKFVFLIGLMVLIHLHLKAQQTNGFDSRGLSDSGRMIFEKIIYHSGHCNGTCPQIDLEIDSNGVILLKRDIWSKKGVTDPRKSGNFKGKIDPETYFGLCTRLFASDYAHLEFP